jgi:leucyl/phenylalanyl-tRNA--protein transferase
MCDAYLGLHNQGLAHAIGWYRAGRLVGGLYGVSVGQLFCGESMVSVERDASKVALAFLMKACTRLSIDLVDCQMPNPHLMSLGAEPMDRDQFLSYLIARRDKADHLQGQKGVFLSYDSDSLFTSPS